MPYRLGGEAPPSALPRLTALKTMHDFTVLIDVIFRVIVHITWMELHDTRSYRVRRKTDV